MSLKEIKTRINSVKSTRQVTSAMQMVSSAKLHHAQQRVEHMLPYQQRLSSMLQRFLASGAQASGTFTVQRPLKRVAIVAFSSNTSLCGAFNSNVARRVEAAVHKYEALGRQNICVIPVGRKIADAVKKMGFGAGQTYEDAVSNPTFGGILPLAQRLVDMYVKGDVDRIELIYHHFRSAGSQTLVEQTYLPMDLTAPATAQEDDTAKRNDNYIVEPSAAELLDDLVPVVLNMQVYAALADSAASEHAARMMAMQTATDNADDLIGELTKQYNKSRQQAITNELLDIGSATSGQ